MKKFTRRKFLQIGAVVSTLTALEAGALQALGEELVKDGKGVSGGMSHTKGDERKFVRTTCLQCGVTDGLLAYTEGEGKNKRIVKIEGNPKHPNTRGVLCAKGTAGAQQVYDPFRIRYPMMRDPEKRGDPKAWKRISWEEAVDELAKRMNDIRKSKDTGRFAFHKGRDRFGDFTKRFTAAFGTKHNFNHTSICEASLKMGYETTFGQDLDASDIANAKMHMSWGENIFEAGYMHNPMAQRISEARVGSNKTKFVVIDPRLSQSAGAADDWLPLNPGTDAAVLLAMSHVLMREGLHDEEFLDTWTNYPTDKLKAYLEEFTPAWAEAISGVPAEKIERIAIEFGNSQPGYARAYNGVSSHGNGTYNARCIALLNAVVGNIDKKGGFCLMKSTGFGKVEPSPDVDKIIKSDGLTGEFPLKDVTKKHFKIGSHGADHLLPVWMEEADYKVGVYFLHMYNPVYSNPDVQMWLDSLKNTSRFEFIVDFSPFVSETVQECVDLVIPDCTYLERFMISDMPAVENFPYVHVYQPVIEPLYESRSMYDTMLAVAKKVEGMEKYFAFETVEDYCRESTEAKWGPGSWERLKEDGVLINPSRKFKDPKVKPADPGYKSYDELTPEELEKARQFDTFRDVLKAESLEKMVAEGAKMPTGDGPIRDKDDKKTLGVFMKGIAYKGFETHSGLWETFSEELEEHGYHPLPIYEADPGRGELAEDQFIMTTGKVNVHTQSRTPNCAWLMELMHYNPVWINTVDAKRLGIESGDDIELETGLGVKKMQTKAYVTEGIMPGAVFQTFSFGHWEYGPMGTRGKDPFAALPHQDFKDSAAIEKAVDGEWYMKSDDLAGMADVWWHAKKYPGDSASTTPNGAPTIGWLHNWILANDLQRTDPIGGEYAFNGIPVRIKKVEGSDKTAMKVGGAVAAGLGVAAVKNLLDAGRNKENVVVNEHEHVENMPTPDNVSSIGGDR